LEDGPAHHRASRPLYLKKMRLRLRNCQTGCREASLDQRLESGNNEANTAKFSVMRKAVLKKSQNVLISKPGGAMENMPPLISGLEQAQVCF